MGTFRETVPSLPRGAGHRLGFAECAKLDAARWICKMLDHLPLLKDLGIRATSYEGFGDVVTVRIDGLTEDLFTQLTKSTGPQYLSPEGWYLFGVKSLSRTPKLAECSLLESVTLTFRQMPKTLFTAEDVQSAILARAWLRV